MKHIYELRKESGWTQTELADRLNISQQAVSKYEKEEREPDIDVLLQIAELFNVSTDYLLGITDIKFPYGKADKQWKALEKRVSDLEEQVQNQFAMSEIIYEFCKSVANKEKLSLLSYQQLYSPSTYSNEKVRMLLEKAGERRC